MRFTAFDGFHSDALNQSELRSRFGFVMAITLRLLDVE